MESKLKRLCVLHESAQIEAKLAQEALRLIELYGDKLRPRGGLQAEIALYKRVEADSIQFATTIEDLIEHLKANW